MVKVCLGAVYVLGMLLLTSCGSGQSCPSGMTRVCVCGNGQSSFQTCSFDGSSWSACDCSTSGSGGSGGGQTNVTITSVTCAPSPANTPTSSFALLVTIEGQVVNAAPDAIINFGREPSGGNPTYSCGDWEVQSGVNQCVRRANHGASMTWSVKLDAVYPGSLTFTPRLGSNGMTYSTQAVKQLSAQSPYCN